MIAALSFIALGFFVGMRHATDADHVIAVSTIVSRQRTVRGSVVVGAVWGLGHTLTILAVGGAIIVFRVVIPPVLGLTLEMTVAMMLVALGVSNVTGVVQDLRRRVGGGTVDADPHPVHQMLRPLVVGLVHGLAGSAAVALLVLATINDARWALAYLLLVGVGTIVGMMLITATIAAPLAYASRRSARVEHHLRVASGLLSVGVGVFLVYQIGFVEGLFMTPRTWTPR